MNPDGSFTYTPTTDYFGPDSFSYQINDGKADFRWEIHQTVPGMLSFDAFAIDYFELSLCTGDDR